MLRNKIWDKKSEIRKGSEIKKMYSYTKELLENEIYFENEKFCLRTEKLFEFEGIKKYLEMEKCV